MPTWGGRPAARAARPTRAAGTRAALPALGLALALGPAALVGCATPAADAAHDVRADVARLGAVATVEASGPTADRSATIQVVLARGTGPTRAAAVVRGVGRAAAAQGWSSYRLELRDVEDRGDVLVADESFRSGIAATIEAYRRVGDAVLGPLTWTTEPTGTTIAVAADGALLHDAQEAGRTTYGDRATTWRLTAGPSTAVLDRKVGPLDLELVRRAQRSLASPSLPAPAARWWLEVREDHVLLDLVVDLPGGPVAASSLLPRTAGRLVRPLALAAKSVVAPALSSPGSSGTLPVAVRLRQPGPVTDVFAWWTSDRPPVRGRDPLARGWDAWLADLYRRS